MESPTVTVKNGNGVNYTVPQLVRPVNLDKSVEIFFRTNKVRGKSLIKVTSGDTLIAQYRREHMAPGEMEKISIPKLLFAKVGEELTVEVCDDEA